ncbi:MAG: hypothetical protein ABIV25_01835 [Paracoccaceae bacterium]
MFDRGIEQVCQPVEVPVRHGLATRWVHAALAIAVGMELVTGLIMQGPKGGHPVDMFYRVHQVSDAGVLALAAGFWAVIAMRHGGTALGAMVPWFNRARLRAMVVDVRRSDAPPYREGAPITAAVRGAELGLVTIMAFCGVSGEPEILHDLLGGLVWLVVILHLLMALLHHYGIDHGISEMWRLGRGSPD